VDSFDTGNTELMAEPPSMDIEAAAKDVVACAMAAVELALGLVGGVAETTRNGTSPASDPRPHAAENASSAGPKRAR